MYESQGTHTFAPVLLSDWTADITSCPSTPELNVAFNDFDVKKLPLQNSKHVMSASSWKPNLIGSTSDLSFYEAVFNSEMENEAAGRV